MKIIITSFGKRDIQPLINNIKEYTDIPIEIYSEDNCDTWWHNHKRWGVRNSNYHKATAALNNECCLILDDDMRIVSDKFIQGFDLADRFGICLPMNPRVFVKYNSMGADSSNQNPIPYATACNMSPMFVNSKVGNTALMLEEYKSILRTAHCRGTHAIWLASYNTYTPITYLPEQWCVCRKNAKHIKNYTMNYCGKKHKIEPIMLHYGQEGVRDAFDSV